MDALVLCFLVFVIWKTSCVTYISLTFASFFDLKFIIKKQREEVRQKGKTTRHTK